jgi:glutamate transport system permease protein
MTAPVIADALGPRARRRVRVASAVSVLVLAGIVALMIGRLAENEQFDADKWQPFTERGVIRFLWLGLVATLKAAAVAMVLATLLGGLLALGRLARNGPVRWLSGAYVEVFRAVPLLLLILFCDLGLPRLGVELSPFGAVVLGLLAYNGAVLGEIFRAGILSLDRGQTDAALAVGLSYWQTMLRVVIPQAVRRMVPALVSQLVTLLKDTSLGLVVGYEELLRRADILGEYKSGPLLQALFVVALMYIAVNLALSRLANRLEIRQRRRYRAGKISVSGVEDLAVMEAVAEAPAK